jgi:simple sugar transport system substrate-binding protein
MRRMNKRWVLVVVVALLAILVPTGCGKKQQTTGPSYKFTMVIFGTAGNPFWTKIVNGAKEAADTLKCSVDVQFADNDATKQNDIIETAISNKVDGIGVSLNFDDAYDEVVKKARDKGIAVVAFNIDDSKKAAGNARMAYIGQDMETAGYIISQRLIAEGKLKKGDLVVCPVEHPEAVYAVQRYAGARKAFGPAGIKSEVLNTGGVSLEDTLNKLTQIGRAHV